MYEELVLDALHGKLGAVKANFDSVTQLRHPFLSPLQPVTVSGAIKGHGAVLRFGMDNGAVLNRDVAVAVKKGAQISTSVETWYQSNKALVDEVANIKPEGVEDPDREEIIWNCMRSTKDLW